MTLLRYGPTAAVISAIITEIFAPRGRRPTHSRPMPYSRPQESSSLPQSSADSQLEIVDLKEMKKLRKEVQKQKFEEFLGDLSSIDISSTAGEDTCYSTWKGGERGSEGEVTVWAHRESPEKPYHTDCINFHWRLNSTTSGGNSSSPFKTLIPEAEVSGSFQYMSKYYVNLKYFMLTQLEGDGLTCQQQLDRRIHEGLAHFGVYRWAFDTVRKITTNDCGRWEFWSRDEMTNKRGVEMAFVPSTGKIKIIALSVLSFGKMEPPSGYPLHHARADELTERAWPLLTGKYELLPFDLLLACGKAARALLESEGEQITEGGHVTNIVSDTATQRVLGCRRALQKRDWLWVGRLENDKGEFGTWLSLPVLDMPPPAIAQEPQEPATAPEAEAAPSNTRGPKIAWNYRTTLNDESEVADWLKAQGKFGIAYSNSSRNGARVTMYYCACGSPAARRKRAEKNDCLAEGYKLMLH
ncbi:hypothetical protein FOZ61_002861 [Perkinsus olseni]|uniref:Uncharacterized protein n=1 Tax=Perkinsus olseni TaxID=32597 RepID=A0A7J6LRM5_PEROL|nr:hypothetical protein FOZ61_002861 [Perkinsus olseni]